MERGDADISFDLDAKDFSEMKAAGKLKLISNAISNGMYSVELNVVNPPFNNEKVRQAVAYAIPYQKIVDAAMFGVGNPLFGGPSNDVSTIAWPQPTGYTTDLEKAKALMSRVGLRPDRYHHIVRSRRRGELRAHGRTHSGEPQPYRHHHDHQ